MSSHRPRRPQTLAGFVAVAALGGLSLAEGLAQDPNSDPAPPGSADALVADDAPLADDAFEDDAFEDDVLEDAGDDAGLPPLLGTPGGDPAAVRLIRNGRVVAAGTLEDGGGFEAGAMPPGVYTVAGQADGGMALFAYKIREGKVSVDDGPIPLVAPASDWPLARSILAEHFPLAPAPANPRTPAPPGAAPPVPGAVAPAAAPMALRPIAAKRTAANRRAAGVRPGDVGRIEQYDATGALRPVPRAAVYLIRSGELVTTLGADELGLFTLPETLDTGLHTLVSIGIARDNAMPGASVTGLNVTAARTRSVSDEQDAEEDDRPLVRPVAFRKVVKQGPAFSVTQAPGSDVAPALGGTPPGPPGAEEPGPPGLAAGGPAGFGGGGAAGGGAGGGFGGGLLPALIGAGIGAGIAAAVDDDDDDEEADTPRGFGAGGTPPAASPARANAPPFSGGVPVGNGNGRGNGNGGEED